MEKSISAESDKRVRELLCAHQMFRRFPLVVFNNPECVFWTRYQDAINAVKEDKDINVDFQWKQPLKAGATTYMLDSVSMAKELRPENPRIEEVHNIITLRPSIFDMENDTDIFKNACREFPLMDKKDALYRACEEIYLSIDRDLFLFFTDFDKKYGTDFIDNSVDHVLELKREDKAYRLAEQRLQRMDSEKPSRARKDIYRQEFCGYISAILGNRQLAETPVMGEDGQPMKFTDYKGLDVLWAKGRRPNYETMSRYFANGLIEELRAVTGKKIAEGNDPFRQYEALLDRIEYSDVIKRKELVQFYTSDIMYGFGYTKIKEGKIVGRSSASKRPRKKWEPFVPGR